MEEYINERYELETGRLKEIAAGADADPAFRPFFEKTAGQLLLFEEERLFLRSGADRTPEEWKTANHRLYEDILPDRYGNSYANPVYACSLWGEEYGQILSALAWEIRSSIPYIYEGADDRAQIRTELFLEFSSAFAAACAETGTGVPKASHLKQKLYRYVYDSLPDEVLFEVEYSLAGKKSAASEILEQSDPSDPRTVYRYGEYISDNETGMSDYLKSAPEEKAAVMADVFTEGFRKGFEITGKDLSKKKTAGLYYHAGFERMMAKAVKNLSGLGISAVVPRVVPTLFRLFSASREGLSGAVPNRQAAQDHSEDLALIIDDELITRKTDVLAGVYRKLRDKTVLYAGPAVLETFGQRPFTPDIRNEAISFSAAEREKLAALQVKESVLYDKAVIGKERSFTIIAFPLPEISATQFPEIFDAVIRINTLDSGLYQNIQQKIVDALDRADFIRVEGKGSNRTRLEVAVLRPSNPEKESAFENCTADVNIPVGEVFTTPVLRGTNGILHVSEVFIDGYGFKDLFLRFTDGMVTDYGCGNFENPAEGRKFIEKHILFNHRSLPMGECAIGTNTEAYAAARRYGILDRLPVLIAEKTGPHFAVGDTCYSTEEENRTFNPDGKEIIAKDNDISILRKTSPEKAYFGCHTDITVPFGELKCIAAVGMNGETACIIQDGLFVLPGTEELNGPLK